MVGHHGTPIALLRLLGPPKGLCDTGGTPIVLSLVPDGHGLYTSAELLRAGDLVAMPTETVYGLAADAFAPAAIVKIFDAKERPRFDPLIVHLPEGPPDDVVEGVVELVVLASRGRERFGALTDHFWPGPLTLVLPRHPRIPDLVTSGRETVAVRMPDHPVTQALLEAFGGPLVAPSANRFGSISPTSAADVRAELEGRIAAVLDGGRCPLGVESTIVAIDRDGALRLLRPGALPVEDIETVAPVERAMARGDTAAPESPGQLSRHYAPGTPLVLVDDLETPAEGPPSRLALLRVSGDPDLARRAYEAAGHTVVDVVSLSRGGDLAEAARELFAALRRLDDCGADTIVAERSPTSSGLGFAIEDRLQRASALR